VNLLLLLEEDFLPDGIVRLTGRRAAHARIVLRIKEGERLRVGKLNGPVGEGRVLRVSSDELRLQVSLTDQAPKRPGVDLLLAMPRPKALKRVLSGAASLGVDRIVLLNAARVEKSYFDSKVIDEGFMRNLLIEGLEQARDTQLPTVFIRNRLKPFVEDELDGFLGPEPSRVLAHPITAARAVPSIAPRRRTAVAIGPEGGWTPFEIDLLTARGFEVASFGVRSLRVEVFVPFVLGWLQAEHQAQTDPPA
jgi:16S rRNA (uracil1498-N3)-methyltransferase